MPVNDSRRPESISWGSYEDARMDRNMNSLQLWAAPPPLLEPPKEITFGAGGNFCRLDKVVGS